MDPAKLEKLKANVRIGGKGTPRRKLKRNVNTEGDDTKVQAALQKLNAQTLTDVDQVTMFKEDGNVITFGRPAVQQAAQYNTMAIHGHSVQKSSAELIPDMLKNMSPEQIKQIQELSARYEKEQAEGKTPGQTEDAEVPNLVEGEAFDKVD